MRRLVAPALAALALVAAPGAAHGMSIPAPPCPAVTPPPEPAEGVEAFVFLAQTCSFAPTQPDWTVGVDWGDGTWSAGVFEPVSWIVGGTHAYRRAGTYTAKAAMIHTPTGSGWNVQRTVTVADQPRTAVRLREPRFTIGRLGTSQPLVAFDDANQRAFAADYTATIDWGDGRTSRGTVHRDEERRFTILGRHRYGRERHRTITVTVRGRQGEKLTLRTRALVGRVYDAVPKRRPGGR